MVGPLHAKLSWHSGLRFSACPDSGHELTIDSTGRKNHAGPSPMELVLIGVAGCTAMDVVYILERMRTPVSALDVEIAGERAQTDPKRFTSFAITYRARGAGLDPEKVERAVRLSHESYCSVLATVRPDCKVSTVVEILEG